ncbi:MAG TPA: serine/threonine protein kinase [Desulfobacterales bacterium]|nr:serine/threonine protein kinase [Desulfobacterales bacterium]
MANPEVGDTLDIFTLRSKLHEGALANLFLAEDQLSREQVVLKIPCGDILNQPIILYHYQNEERISRLLDHPGVVRFIHRQRSRQYIIMEKISGPDLRSKVGKNRRLAPDEALRLMNMLCEIVGYLHSQSIVHLDLKPENIICLENGKIKLIDFGLASCRKLPDLLAVDLQNPQGTPWYIAPEQLLGERSDPRCDTYSMGMMLYEMLTGQLPWPRSSKVSIARRRLRHDPVPPRYYNLEIPSQLQSIILRAISRHADDRYPSVKQLDYDLKHWQKLPVTDIGLNCKRPSIWKRLFYCNAVQRNTENLPCPEKSTSKPQVIGAILDSSTNKDMLVEVRKQALIRSCEATLVHVIEEDSDSHVRRYGMTVEGEKLMVGLEYSVQNLRRFSIDPGIRLIRGEVVEVLKAIGNDPGTDLLVLGPSRKKKSFMRGASLQRRLAEQCDCKVMVATEEKFSAETDLKDLLPDQLTEQQVLSCDIFLVDLWFEHLHYHTDFIYQLLLYPEKAVDLSKAHCRFGLFLESLETSRHWLKITSMLNPIHQQFHEVATKMAELPLHDHTGLQELYINESMPLSCKLKKELGHVSLLLRSYLKKAPPSVPFLIEESCPITMPHLACYGPLLRAFNLSQDLSVLIRNADASITKTQATIEGEG